MKKKRTILFGSFLALLILFAGALIWFRLSAPPGEEWISYGNEELIASIDRQLDGLDMERIMADKEALVLEQDVAALQQAAADGRLSYEELTAICLFRIKTLDQSRHGYNSVIEVAPDAIEQARSRDLERHKRQDAGQPLPPLLGIPVMLKDNINTAGIPTSAGAQAFAGFIPGEDAKLVSMLREQGAVILGKNNLSEFAYYVSSVMPSGYSGRKGQTVNPFRPLKISPSGSSSGSAVAVTAGLVPVSIGTETAGSIAGPAAANSVVGFKPTRGSISAEGVFPLIRAVDTPGPIAKTVGDAALAFSCLSGSPFPRELDPAALKGASIGLVSYEYNDSAMIQTLQSRLEEAGAQVFSVPLDQKDVQVQNIIRLTFKQDFEEFASRYGFPITRLEDLIEYNEKDADRRIKYGQDQLEDAALIQTPDPSQIQLSIHNAAHKLEEILSEYDLDAVVFLGTSASAAVSAAGFPELTVPLGMNAKGVPQGATFAAGYGEDWKLLNLGYAFEQSVRGRRAPGR
ncbi:MAG: hypothetical protein LIP16_19975 [Clostridium sp.]|nr:hypothetical protein [Clostridium sp.]